MKEEIETNRAMESREYPASILSTTDSEAVRNLQMCVPTLKVEIKEELTAEYEDDEEIHCSDFMHPSEPLDPSKFVNYYDNKDYVYELKKEFPEDECSQSDCNMNSKIVTENMELLKTGNTKEELSLNIKEENESKEFQVTIKMERLEDIVDNTEATSIHYDVLVTPQVVKCKLCGRIFKNSFNLLKHNNGHIKIDISAPGDNKLNVSHQNCVVRFDNQDNMLANVDDVHSRNILKGDLGKKEFKSLKSRSSLLQKLKESPKRVTGKSFECKYCNVNFESRSTLYNHVKLCRLGKEDVEIKYKCDSCDRSYQMKNSLRWHIRKVHCDYGRTFDCWCGRQFRTPIHLREHKRLRHVTKIKIKNNEEHKCKHCEAVFNEKPYLSMHMKRVHCDYGRTFECWCGKEFRTPINLREHKSRQHAIKIKVIKNDSNNEKLQCDSCHKYYKTKPILVRHKKNFHCDYGDDFKCWCGRRFLTAILLDEHRNRLHGGKINGEFQCDFCQRIFKHKHNLGVHIKTIHFHYK